jgi:hypothetical protein
MDACSRLQTSESRPRATDHQSRCCESEAPGSDSLTARSSACRRFENRRLVPAERGPRCWRSTNGAVASGSTWRRRFDWRSGRCCATGEGKPRPDLDAAPNADVGSGSAILRGPLRGTPLTMFSLTFGRFHQVRRPSSVRGRDDADATFESRESHAHGGILRIHAGGTIIPSANRIVAAFLIISAPLSFISNRDGCSAKSRMPPALNRRASCFP